MRNAFCIRKIITSLVLGDNYSRLARAINTLLCSARNTSTSACVVDRAFRSEVFACAKVKFAVASEVATQ